MDERRKVVLKENHQILRTGILVRNVLPALRSLLTDIEYSRVDNKEDNVSGVDELITILLTKENSHFERFCAALQKNGYEHWAKKLLEDVQVEGPDVDDPHTHWQIQYPIIDELTDEFGLLVADVDSAVRSLSHVRLQGLKTCFEEKLKSKNTPPGVVTSSAEDLIHTMSKFRDSLNFEFVRLVVRYLKDEGLQKRMEAYEAEVRRGTEKLLTECNVDKITPHAPPGCKTMAISLRVDSRSYSLYRVLEIQDFLVRRIGVSLALFAGWSKGSILLYFYILTEHMGTTVLQLNKHDLQLRNQQVEAIHVDGILIYPPNQKLVEDVQMDGKDLAISACKTDKATEDPDVKTCVTYWDKKDADQHKIIPPPARPMKSKSKLIEKGPPEVYQLPLEHVGSGRGVVKYTIGKPPRFHVPVFVVMVVGATGAGKSTLINGFVNYILGVERKDPFRFKLIDDGTGSQAHSKTKDIIAYTIYKQEGSPFPHTLTIIDTPGFGDMEGIKGDEILVKQVRKVFSMGGVKGIDCIHAIGFVTQAPMVRLTSTQKYIFDSILSIFGVGIKHNILLMTTFADSRRPAVLDAVKAAEIPYTEFFKFNNSALFLEPPDAQSGNECERPSAKFYWNLCMDNFDRFAKQLMTMQAQSLTLTKEVLEERQQLEIIAQDLQKQLRLMVGRIGELNQEKQCMKENEAKIAASRNFTYTVRIPKIIKYDLSGTGMHVTNCLQCNYTCHSNCTVADGDLTKCSAMKDGSCTVCPKRCQWNRHVSNPWRFEVTEETEERTVDELKRRFDEATEMKSRMEVMVANIQAEISSISDETMRLVDRAQQTYQRLDEIAMKPNPLSKVDYVDLLIQFEKDEGKDGFQERILCLKVIRKKAELSIVQSKGLNVHGHQQEAAQFATRKPTRS